MTLNCTERTLGNFIHSSKRLGYSVLISEWSLKSANVQRYRITKGGQNQVTRERLRIQVFECARKLQSEKPRNENQGIPSQTTDEFEIKMSAGNTIQVINLKAVSLIRHGVAIFEWTKLELQGMDRKTRKKSNVNEGIMKENERKKELIE